MSELITNETHHNRGDITSMLLRIGLGLVFVIGGTSKLSLLLSAEASGGMVANYLGTTGYINTVFQDYLFTGVAGKFLTAWGFLTALSTFELFSGICLIVGFLVRPLALVYAFLLWTFVIALPVMTVPGETIDVKAYTSPALFVQVRDVALSGMMFVLFFLGAGRYSIDHKRVPHDVTVPWDTCGTILRLSLGVALLVGGLFHGYGSIATWATAPAILVVVGLALMLGNNIVSRVAGGIAIAIMVWFIANKLNADKSIIANLNGFKREFALAACGGALAAYGGSQRFTAPDLYKRSMRYLRGYFKRSADNADLALN